MTEELEALQDPIEEKLIITEWLTLEQIAKVLDRDYDYELEEVQAVLKLLPSKVDGCVQYRDRLADEAARAKEYAKRFADLAKQIENRSAKFEGYLQVTLETNNFEKLKGDAFYIELKKNPPSVVTSREPSAEDSFNLAGYVSSSVKYSWNKKAIKAAIESGSALDFAELVNKQSLKVGINK
jgi:hypothetical protein